MTSPDVIVVGAGVLGLCTAAELASRGRRVVVVDPGGPNASSVAAGMLAPALESLLDRATPERAALLLRARDLWPAFAAAHDIIVHREGADWRGPGASGHVADLRALGFQVEPADGGLTTPDDWRVEAKAALDSLARTQGLEALRAHVRSVDHSETGWRIETDEGGALSAADLVISTGAASSLPGLPEPAARLIDSIQPIKGQLTYVRVDPPERVLRGPNSYVAPTRQGVLIGATMQAGLRDLEPDAAEAGRQVAEGLGMLGRTAAEAGDTRVGVRGSVPDGLPMAGRVGPGLHLALAPRRNGWLLGPMVGRIVADEIEGAARSPDAAALDPLRFTPAG